MSATKPQLAALRRELRRDCEPGLRAMAQRSVDAENNFVATLAQLGEISEADARTVFDAYVALGIAKRDIVMGRYSVTHGAFLDRENIRRALSNLQAK